MIAARHAPSIKPTAGASPLQGARMCNLRNNGTRSRHVLLARSHGNSDAGSLPDELMERALAEAAEIYAQAERQAREQLKQELQQYWTDEMDKSGGPGQEEAPLESLEAFFQEHGLSGPQSHYLAQELVERKSPHRNLSLLSTHVQRMARVIPINNVCQLLSRDPDLVDVPAAQLARRMISLVDVMPGVDVVDVVCRQPRLLRYDDLPDRYRRVLAKLVEVHPTHNPSLMAKLIVDHPQLLFRMDFYMEAKWLDELPMEFQNWMLTLRGNTKYAAINKDFNEHAAYHI